MRLFSSILFASVFFIVGCGGSSNNNNNNNTNNPNTDSLVNLVVPTTYSFKSKFDPNKSSVDYSGQVFRQVLQREMGLYIKSLTAKIDANTIAPARGDTLSALKFYYEFDSASDGATALQFSTTPALQQATHNDISTNKELKQKFAGNDLVGQYKDWSKGFIGWDNKGLNGVEGSIKTPEELLLAFFDKLDELAFNRSIGTPELDPQDKPITSVQVSAEGWNLQELIDKFLVGAINISQGIDDYLDDDVAGKGLNADNTKKVKDTVEYTELEHNWDEAFGYFGCMRAYQNYTDAELTATGGNVKDADGDGFIDIQSEFNFGIATYANRADARSNASATTDFSKTIFDAFLKGRAIISHAKGNLTTDEMKELKKQRDIVANTWERIIAANLVFYLNKVLVNMGKMGTADYSFTSHAGTWSEMKGFALSLQFNSKKLISDSKLTTIHEKIGNKPVVDATDAVAVTAYKTALLDVRQILKDIYGFADANMGDENGIGGW